MHYAVLFLRIASIFFRSVILFAVVLFLLLKFLFHFSRGSGYSFLKKLYGMDPDNAYNLMDLPKNSSQCLVEARYKHLKKLLDPQSAKANTHHVIIDYLKRITLAYEVLTGIRKEPKTENLTPHQQIIKMLATVLSTADDIDNISMDELMDSDDDNVYEDCSTDEEGNVAVPVNASGRCNCWRCQGKSSGNANAKCSKKTTSDKKPATATNTAGATNKDGASSSGTGYLGLGKLFGAFASGTSNAAKFSANTINNDATKASTSTETSTTTKNKKKKKKKKAKNVDGSSSSSADAITDGMDALSVSEQCTHNGVKTTSSQEKKNGVASSSDKTKPAPKQFVANNNNHAATTATTASKPSDKSSALNGGANANNNVATKNAKLPKKPQVQSKNGSRISEQNRSSSTANGRIKQQQNYDDDDNDDSSSDDDTIDLSAPFIQKAVTKVTNAAANKNPRSKSVTKSQLPATKEKEATEEEIRYEKLAKSREFAVQGNEAANEENFAEAAALFTQAINLSPTEYRYYGNRSLVYDRMGKYDLSLLDADRCIDIKPDWVTGYFRRGRALLGLERYSDAENCFKTVLDLEAGDNSVAQEITNIRVLRLIDMGYTTEQVEDALKHATRLDDALKYIRGLETNISSSRSSTSGSSAASSTSNNNNNTNNNNNKKHVGHDDGPAALWVGNVAYGVSEAFLHDLFSRFGMVSSVRVLPDKHCAFVNFYQRESAQIAKENMNGYFLLGYALRVEDSDISKAKDSVAPPVVPVANITECKFWRGSGCRNGPYCRFAHIPSQRGVDEHY